MMQDYSTSYSSSNSSYLSQNPEQPKPLKHASSFQSHPFLHSVRKSIAKPCRKAPVAPLPPSPIKVYKVDPINFRDLVQQLTGAPEFKPRAPHHLPVASFVDARPPNPILSSRDIAAASSPVFSWSPKSPMSALYQDVQFEAMGVKYQENTVPGSLELNLSSPSYNWYSFPPMSPGSMTSLEPGRVL